jgi:hypothetical protein
LPDLAHARTGGNGDHHLFRVGPEWEVRKRLLDAKGLPGIDVIGRGGYVAVEPSIHPRTGREYVWLNLGQPPYLGRGDLDGIPEAPEWLQTRLRDAGLLSPAVEVRDRQGASRAASRHPAGSVEWLIEEMIERFPVPAVGTRNGFMVQVLNSLHGRGYDDGTVEAVTLAWWAHWHRQGTARTMPSRTEVRKNLESLKRRYDRQDFAYVTTAADHLGGCLSVELRDWPGDLLGSEVSALEDWGRRLGLATGPAGPLSGECHTPLRSGPLCRPGTHDAAFVEAWVRRVVYQVVRGEATITATNGQLMEIARGLGASIRSPQQLERLKLRYITRAGKPAERFELLRVVQSGWKDLGRPQEPGTPSIYLPTGILLLLPSEVRRAFLASGSAA